MSNNPYPQLLQALQALTLNITSKLLGRSGTESYQIPSPDHNLPDMLKEFSLRRRVFMFLFFFLRFLRYLYQHCHCQLFLFFCIKRICASVFSGYLRFADTDYGP